MPCRARSSFRPGKWLWFFHSRSSHRKNGYIVEFLLGNFTIQPIFTGENLLYALLYSRFSLHIGFSSGNTMAGWIDGWMDGWLATLLPFQQYFSHIRTMGGWKWKDVCIGTPYTVEKISPRARIDPGTARSVGQRLTHWVTGAPTMAGKFASDGICSLASYNSKVQTWNRNISG